MVTGGTIGVFDLLHVGHIRFLQKCRSQCDRLLVGVGGDRICTHSKGKRPVIDQSQRAELLEMLRCVDGTKVFDIGLDNTDQALQWIAGWGVSVVFVSEDWAGSVRWNKLEPLLQQQGIRCLWVPYTEGISTSQIIRQIRQF